MMTLFGTIPAVDRNTHDHIWREANVRLIPSAILALCGAIICSEFGNVQSGNLGRKLVSLVGIFVFIIFATAFLHVLTRAIYKLLCAHNFGVGRAAAIQFMLRIIGYIIIFFSTLGVLNIPIAKLLFGGAIIGIILGVAAQQALANFFASIVLIVSHPFTVGENITLFSGALGGKYVGTVMDIGLTHTRLKESNGNIIFLPNTALLSGAAILAEHQGNPPKAKKD